MNGLAEAHRRGGELLEALTRDGSLVLAELLAQARHLMPAQLKHAPVRGEVFALEVTGQLRYPALLMALPRADVAAVCRLQQHLTPSEQLIFWLREHGGLSGRTVGQAMAAGELPRVLELARAWAAERAS